MNGIELILALRKKEQKGWEFGILVMKN